MKILFISAASGVDYQCDCVFHGLNCLDDVEVYTINDLWYMYRGNPSERTLELYGKGFTITNRVPVEKRNLVDIDTAKKQIADRLFDVVIYGSIWRCDQLLEQVLTAYPRNKVIFIDGEDFTFGPDRAIWTRGVMKKSHYKFRKKHYARAKELAEKGVYYKRELRTVDSNRFYPISFAVPRENLVDDVPAKTQEMATIVPGDLKTYIYDTEKAYYEGYQIARFGTTFKKAGWDCLRHYEILSNGCIPYFPDLKKCPDEIMVNFPKNIILETNRLYERKLFTDELYTYYADWLLNYTRQYLTTKTLAEYILSLTPAPETFRTQ